MSNKVFYGVECEVYNIYVIFQASGGQRRETCLRRISMFFFFKALLKKRLKWCLYSNMIHNDWSVTPSHVLTHL